MVSRAAKSCKVWRVAIGRASGSNSCTVPSNSIRSSLARQISATKGRGRREPVPFRCYLLPQPCSNSLFPKPKFRCFSDREFSPKYLKQCLSLARPPQWRAVQPRNSLFFDVAEQQRGARSEERAERYTGGAAGVGQQCPLRHISW